MVSALVIRGIKTNAKFFEIFVSIPYIVKVSERSVTLVHRSRRQLTYWFFVSIIVQIIIGLHIGAYVVYTLTIFDILTDLQIQRTFAYIVYGCILIISLFLNLFFATHYHDCQFFVREGFRMDVHMTGIVYFVFKRTSSEVIYSASQ